MKKSASSCNFRRRLLSLSVACATVALAGTTTARADSLAQARQPDVPATAAQGTVRGDRCNVRARPSLNSEVVVQLNKGDRVEILERRTAGEPDKTMQWLRIRLPGTAKCYVASKHLTDGVANVDALNVRCGPGANYRAVGKLAKGERVEVIKTEGEWTQIKPTAQCSGWIAAELVQEEAAPLPEPAAQLGALEVVTPPVAAPPAAAPAAPAVGITDPDVQIQYVVKNGVLRAVKDPASAPGSYELMTPEVERRHYRIAYLEAPGINLDRFEGKHVRVLGHQRWHRGQRYPVIAVERVDMVW